MVETLGFEILADDKATSATGRVSAAVRKASNDLELAQIRVAKATEAAKRAVDDHGESSLKAREAVARLARAELDAESASVKLGAAQKKTGESIKDTENKARGFRSALADVGKSAAGFLAGSAISAGLSRFQEFANQSVEAASSLGESINAIQKVFGDSQKAILDWGANNAASFGLSQRAFNEMATPLGAGLKNAGLSMQDTAKWTIDLTKRASDMASVFNTSVPDALEAIQAGLRGEADPLERYGVGLSAAAVQAEAMAETHKKAAGQLTNTELATARLNLIMKQTASTEGDFQSTSNGLANAQRIATAEMENAKAKLGGELLPIMAKVTSVTASAVGGFASLPGPIQATAAGAVALGGAALLLLPRISAAKTALSEMGVTAEGLKGKLGGAAATVGKFGAVLAAAQLAGQAFAVDSGAKGIDTTTKALAELAAKGTDTSGTLKNLDYDLGNIGQTGRSVGGFLEGLTGNFAGLAGDKAISAVDARITALDGSLAQLVSSGNAGQAAKIFGVLAEKAKQQGTSIETLKDRFPQYQNELDKASAAEKKNAEVTTKATSAADKQAAAQKKLADALDYSKNKLLIATGGESGYWASIDAVTAALKQNGKTLDLHTEKGRSNRAALDAQATAALDYLSALQQTNAPAGKFNATLDDTRKRLYNAALSFGMTKAEARAYVDQLLRVPRAVNTNIGVNYGNALQKINNVLYSLNKLSGKTVSAYIRVDVLGNVAPVRGVPTARAAGGIIPGPPSRADTVPAWLSTGEYVVNAASTMRYRGVLDQINGNRYAGGGFVTLGSAAVGRGFSGQIVVNSPFGVRSEVMAAVVEGLRLLIRNGGGNVQTYLGAS